MKIKNSLSKQILSLVLALVMVLGMLPLSAVPAHAATESPCSGDHSGWTAITTTGQTTISKPGKYYLQNNMTGTVNYTTLKINCTGDVTICLNGKTINSYPPTNTSTYRKAIDLQSGNLSLCDCVGSGKITRMNNWGSAEGVAIASGTTFNMYGGTFTGLTSGAVTVNGVFNMYGGSISGNANNWNDVIVDVSTGGTFNMYGGSITNNTGIGVRYGSGAQSIHLTGDVKISGNTAENLRLQSGKTVTVGELTDGAEIYVTSADTANDVAITGTNSTDYSKYFHADDSSYQILNKDNVIYLHKHSYSAANCVAPATCACGLTEGSEDSTNHNISTEWTTENGKHYHACLYGCGTHVDEAACSGGTASCGSAAICSVCQKEYGSKLEHSLQYTANDNVLTETCESNCGYNETATLEYSTGNGVYAYTGQAVTPVSVTYSDGWTGNKPTVTYLNNTNVGKNASGSLKIGDTIATMTFEITAADISGATVTLNPDSGNYTGNAYTPDVTVTHSQFGTLTNDDYTVSWDKSDLTNVDTYIATIEGKNNFTGTVTKSFTINAATLTDVDVAQVGTLTYDGTAQTPTVSARAVAVNNQLVTFTYSIDQENLGSYKADLPTFTAVGEYTVYYKASAPNHNDSYGNFTVTVNKATLTADDFEFEGPANLVYSPADSKSATITPKDGVTGIGAITVQYFDEQDQPQSYAVDAGKYKVKINVTEGSNYLAADGLTADGWTFTITKGTQNAPTGLVGVAETVYGKNDGKITGVYYEMEYRKDGENTYTAITGNTVENLAAGKYYVRVKGDDNHNPSAETEVIIAAGGKLTVTLPQDQIGYTMTVDKTELEWHGSTTLAFGLADGYSKTDEFAVSATGATLTDNGNGTYTISNAEDNVTVTVNGVADTTTPEAEISISTNKWTQFLNDITFGLFFKETQTVTVTATDAGSGVDKIYYLISETVLTEEEAETLADVFWTEYDESNKPSISPDKECIVYVKVIDKAQNVKVISSTGLVFDGTAPTLEGIEDGKTYYGDLMVIKPPSQFADIKQVTLDGEPMGFAEGMYGLVRADNARHTVIAEDHAGNKTTYTITVMKQYTVTFLADGKVLDTQTVNHGHNAAIPQPPAKAGYDKVAPYWDHDGKNITADTEIHAVYTINTYTVTFLADGKVADTLTVDHGATPVLPTPPAKDGYTVKWDKTPVPATGDMTYTAVYTPMAETPQTGDPMQLGILLLVMLLSGTALAALIVGKKRKMF